MAILVCGLSHKTVPLPVLEQLSFGPDALPKALAQLMDHDEIHEGVILSTCNRTEIYASVHRFHPAVQAVRRFLSDFTGVAAERIADGLYTHYDDAAARHLFNVASGTDSMVVGESEILGQVREAFNVAKREGTAHRMLHQLFERALRVGKRARSETEISRHVVSLPQAAARAASELTGGLAGRTVVVVGAGRMGELAVRAVRDNGGDDIVIANRTFENGAKLAERFDARPIAFDALPDALHHADVVICVTSSPETIVDRNALERVTDDHRLVAIDIAVPRDIDPAARDLANLELRDMDDLRPIVERGAERRRAELPKVQDIVEGEVESFCAWERSLALGPAIDQLRAWAEGIRTAEVDRITRGLDDASRSAVDRATRDLVNKLLHHPMARMRDLVRGKDGQVYLEAFQEIFDLDDR
jgi:glutamyl-tRNA reductase